MELSQSIETDLNIEDNKDYIELEKIRKVIENLDKSHHVEIGKILKQNNIKLSENDNGIFINLSILNNNIILELKEYLEFIKKQEKYINIDEGKKEELENSFFKNIKDNPLELYEEPN